MPRNLGYLGEAGHSEAREKSLRPGALGHLFTNPREYSESAVSIDQGPARIQSETWETLYPRSTLRWLRQRPGVKDET